MATDEQVGHAILDTIAQAAPNASAENLRHLAEAWQLLQLSDDDDDEDDED
jgi:hypothetical protein